MSQSPQTQTQATALAKLGLHTPFDLLHHYPKSHSVYHRAKLADVKVGDTVMVVGQVVRHKLFESRNGKLLVQVWTIANKHQQHRLTCTHFHPLKQGEPAASASWGNTQTRRYPPGTLVQLSGTIKPDDYAGGLAIDAADVLPIKPAQVAKLPQQTIQPHYKLTKGLTAEALQAHIQRVIAQTKINDPLPIKLRERYELIELSQAITQIHYPETPETLEVARRRLVFDEFFYLQLALLHRRQQLNQAQGQALVEPTPLLEKFYGLLPFALTPAQQRVIGEILQDLAQSTPMNRLVQGDVGSGKTVVAVAACLAAIGAGYQAALMAPTEVLATQHYQKITRWLKPLGLNAALLTGSTPAKERRTTLLQLQAGTIHLLVGTHALLTATVQFHQLGLAVIDEQQRFGVEQRSKLQQKGHQPHLLSMTATPIPRTLALTLYGDLDISQIDELPPGRKPIQTQVVEASRRDFIYQLIKLQLTLGHQAYVILPLVATSKQSELQSATEAYDRYQRQFDQYQVGLLHGRMTSAKKDEAINQFRNNTTQILVSTTVVEVGVDVPNATVMVVEHAERFGLSQLHQLRGRVGRGKAQSYCLLLDTSGSTETRQRLEVLAQTNDGFTVAEADMQLRGAGEVLGVKQAGIPQFALADLVRDVALLEQARTAAQQIIKRGDRLTCWQPLLNEIKRRGHLSQTEQPPQLN